MRNFTLILVLCTSLSSWASEQPAIAGIESAKYEAAEAPNTTKRVRAFVWKYRTPLAIAAYVATAIVVAYTWDQWMNAPTKTELPNTAFPPQIQIDHRPIPRRDTGVVLLRRLQEEAAALNESNEPSPLRRYQDHAAAGTAREIEYITADERFFKQDSRWLKFSNTHDTRPSIEASDGRTVILPNAPRGLVLKLFNSNPWELFEAAWKSQNS